MKKNIVFFIQHFYSDSIGCFCPKASGRVFELDENNKKKPLTGVNVYWAHSLQGTTTDSKGYFNISKQESDYTRYDHEHEDDHSEHLLVFSFVGYLNDTIHVHQDQRNIEIILATITELEGVEVSARQSGSFISRKDPIVTQQINRAELHKAACCNLSESLKLMLR